MGGRCVPLPINRRTIEMVFDVRLDSPEAAAAFLRRQAVLMKHRRTLPSILLHRSAFY